MSKNEKCNILNVAKTNKNILFKNTKSLDYCTCIIFQCQNKYTVSISISYRSSTLKVNRVNEFYGSICQMQYPATAQISQLVHFGVITRALVKYARGPSSYNCSKYLRGNLVLNASSVHNLPLDIILHLAEQSKFSRITFFFVVREI